MSKITQIDDTILPSGREWYYENAIDSDVLTIVAGDSWTWGDSLGKTTPKFDDYHYRTSHIYGSLLSKQFGSDFINIGVPGGSNLYILSYLKKVLDALVKPYKKIQVVFTLTESGRELCNGFLEQRDHYNSWAGHSWPSFDSITNQTATQEQLQLVLNEIQGTHFEHVLGLYLAIRPSTSLSELFARYEQYTVSTIRQCVPNVILARNFTSPVDENLFDIKKRWTDIIAENGNLKSYPDKLYVMSQIGTEPLLKFSRHIDKNQFKEQWIDVLDVANTGIQWLLDSPYNSNKASKHPLEQAHQWWANYLFKHIQT